MTRKQKRLGLILGGLGFVGIAVALVLVALSSEITYFHSPTDVIEKAVKPGTRIRLGGLVEEGSIVRGQGTKVSFSITDGEEVSVVNFDGLLPDLFREGQAIVSRGRFTPDTVLVAEEVLAKHDENYVPNEAADAIMLQQANKCDSADGPVDY